MKIIGLTGGIGTGKSTVAHFMEEMGAIIIDADKVGHEAFQPGTGLWHKVVAAFGERILGTERRIDREKLGQIVFNNPGGLAKLNRIMHPAMFDIVKKRIEDYRRQGVGVVVLEATLLLEAGWTTLVDKVWVTVASEASILKRLQKRTGFTGEESLARIRSQMPSAERIKQADVVINTECTLDEVEARVRGLWARINE